MPGKITLKREAPEGRGTGWSLEFQRGRYFFGPLAGGQDIAVAPEDLARLLADIDELRKLAPLPPAPPRRGRFPDNATRFDHG